MSRKNIIILLVIAAIFAAIAFTLFQKNPGIERVVISEDAGITGSYTYSGDPPVPAFSKNSQLYAVIFIKNAKTDDMINIKWINKKNDDEAIVQENQLTLKKEEGSGKIAVSLAKKDSTYQEGSYIVKVNYRDQEFISEFEIKS